MMFSQKSKASLKLAVIAAFFASSASFACGWGGDGGDPQRLTVRAEAAEANEGPVVSRGGDGTDPRNTPGPVKGGGDGTDPR